MWMKNDVCGFYGVQFSLSSVFLPVRARVLAHTHTTSVFERISLSKERHKISILHHIMGNHFEGDSAQYDSNVVQTRTPTLGPQICVLFPDCVCVSWL